jgi:uncharacterized protein (DUF1015 family)
MAHIFSSADILLPKERSNENCKAYSVIACDQFTSEPHFWEECKKNVGDNPSTLDLILPEVYLDKADDLIPKISKAMVEYENGVFEAFTDSMIYVRRTQPDGRVRKGIVGKIDLEYYKYDTDSRSLVRPTEMTVLERIPPRVRIRENATLELPHIMLLIDDFSRAVIEPLEKKYETMAEAYDFELMLGAGHVSGYFIDKTEQRRIYALLARMSTAHYAKKAYSVSDIKPLLFAVGDGNHSLATAKSVYEKSKELYGKEAKKRPERYALVEIVNLHDEALDFEPIYRIVKCNSKEKANELCDFIKNAVHTCDGDNSPYDITLISGGVSEQLNVKHPTKHLPVAFLQDLLDVFSKDNPECTVDYIHGEDSLKMLSNDENTVGFIFKGMDKSELFKSIILDGILPRKTFSMGHALDKRHYLEARKIKYEVK